jgi:hypothetical protein
MLWDHELRCQTPTYSDDEWHVQSEARRRNDALRERREPSKHRGPRTPNVREALHPTQRWECLECAKRFRVRTSARTCRGRSAS